MTRSSLLFVLAAASVLLVLRLGSSVDAAAVAGSRVAGRLHRLLADGTLEPSSGRVDAQDMGESDSAPRSLVVTESHLTVKAQVGSFTQATLGAASVNAGIAGIVLGDLGGAVTPFHNLVQYYTGAGMGYVAPPGAPPVFAGPALPATLDAAITLKRGVPLTVAQNAVLLDQLLSLPLKVLFATQGLPAVVHLEVYRRNIVATFLRAALLARGTLVRGLIDDLRNGLINPGFGPNFATEEDNIPQNYFTQWDAANAGGDRLTGKYEKTHHDFPRSDFDDLPQVHASILCCCVCLFPLQA